MADDDAAVVPASDAGGGQEPPEVSTPEKPDQSSDKEGSSPSSEEPDKKVESPKEGDDQPSGDADKPKEAVDEDKPLHRDLAFQRQQRKIKRLGKQLGKRDHMIEKLVNQVGKFMADQKGEEFTPDKSEPDELDFDELLDDELEEFTAKEGLSSEEEAAVAKIARDYAMDLGDKKVPLPIATAYKIYKESQKGQPVKKEEEVPETKPDAPAKPDEKGDVKTLPGQSLDEIAHSAMQEWKAQRE